MLGRLLVRRAAAIATAVGVVLGAVTAAAGQGVAAEPSAAPPSGIAAPPQPAPAGAAAEPPAQPPPDAQTPPAETAPAGVAPVAPEAAAAPPPAPQPLPPAPLSAVESSADTAPPPKQHPSARPGVGLVGAAGLHTGLALGVRLGLGDVGVELAGGYQLLLAISDDGGLDWDVDAGSSAQGSAELYVTPWHPLPTAAIGLKGGYRYNSVLHHGFSVAVTFLADLSDHLALEGLAGGSFFPGSEDRLRDELGLSPGADFAYSSSAQFFEYGFELIWYPF